MIRVSTATPGTDKSATISSRLIARPSGPACSTYQTATSARPISATSIGPIGRTPVTITAHESGDSVMFRFHNGGPAIPPDVLPFVFEPLARGRRESAGHSIGLGLFIARAIAS